MGNMIEVSGLQAGLPIIKMNRSSDFLLQAQPGRRRPSD